ncbi:MAG TPA: pilus assembly protein PilM [Phycisphaerae bacterium]|nr:pilus assembly protein PilM [Phycisphaerae bacterium]
MRLFDTDQCPIGIDLGAHSIRVLQFRRSGEKEGGGAGPLALQGACRVELQQTSAEVRVKTALEQALEMGSFSGKNVVLALPAASVQSKSVRLPQMPDSDLDQALQWEAKERFGFELADGKLAWFRAGEVRRGTEVKDELLLFAARGETLSAPIAAATALGLKVAAIDLAPCAAYRACKRVAGPELMSIVDIGQGGSQFMMTRNGELVFYKHIDIGGRTINEAVAQKLGISLAEAANLRFRLDEPGAEAAEGMAGESAPLNQALRDAVRTPLEELARELDMCMRYFAVTFRGTRPDVIHLVGRQADLPQVGSILSAALGVRMEAAQPLRGVAELGDVARPDRSAEWAVAAGLSLYPVSARARREEAA